MYKVKVENLKQLDIALSSKNVSEIILARDSFSENSLQKLVDKIKNKSKLAFILMERISRYEESMKSTATVSGDMKREKQNDDLRLSTDKIYEIKNLDGVIIQNLDSFAYMLRKINKSGNEKLKVELNYTMNCYNTETKKLYKTLYNDKRQNADEVPLTFTAPVELNIYELSAVRYDTIILYSFIDTMVTANCLRKTTYEMDKNVGKSKNICEHRFDFDNVKEFSSYIIDRKGKKLHYKTYCKYCYNKIYNTEPLYLLDKIDEIESIYYKGIDIRNSKDVGYKTKANDICKENILNELKYRIDFSFENEEEVKNILNGDAPASFTRGHIKNTIK